MLVRNLNFLSIPKEFSKVEVEIYNNQSIALVYIKGKGYSLVLKKEDNIDCIGNLVVCQTSFSPAMTQSAIVYQCVRGENAGTENECNARRAGGKR